MELKSSMSSLSVLDVYGSMCDCLFDSNGVVVGYIWWEGREGVNHPTCFAHTQAKKFNSKELSIKGGRGQQMFHLKIDGTNGRGIDAS